MSFLPRSLTIRFIFVFLFLLVFLLGCSVAFLNFLAQFIIFIIALWYVLPGGCLNESIVRFVFAFIVGQILGNLIYEIIEIINYFSVNNFWNWLIR